MSSYNEKAGHQPAGESPLKNGKDRLNHIEELLRMTTAQTAENAKQLGRYAKEHNKEMREMRAEFRADFRRSRAEHDREMKEIRALFKDMIRRIAV